MMSSGSPIKKLCVCYIPGQQQGLFGWEKLRKQIFIYLRHLGTTNIYSNNTKYRARMSFPFLLNEIRHINKP